jgi:hypothetical protein
LDGVISWSTRTQGKREHGASQGKIKANGVVGTQAGLPRSADLASFYGPDVIFLR